MIQIYRESLMTLAPCWSGFQIYLATWQSTPFPKGRPIHLWWRLTSSLRVRTNSNLTGSSSKVQTCTSLKEVRCRLVHWSNALLALSCKRCLRKTKVVVALTSPSETKLLFTLYKSFSQNFCSAYCTSNRKTSNNSGSLLSNLLWGKWA